MTTEGGGEEVAGKKSQTDGGGGGGGVVGVPRPYFRKNSMTIIIGKIGENW